jgi:hypothetical protein
VYCFSSSSHRRTNDAIPRWESTISGVYIASCLLPARSQGNRCMSLVSPTTRLVCMRSSFCCYASPSGTRNLLARSQGKRSKRLVSPMTCLLPARSQGKRSRSLTSCCCTCTAPFGPRNRLARRTCSHTFSLALV